MINYNATAWQKESHFFPPAQDLFPSQVVFDSMNVTFSCFQSSKQVICQSPRHVRASHRVWRCLGENVLRNGRKGLPESSEGVQRIRKRFQQNLDSLNLAIKTPEPVTGVKDCW